jgi:phosphoenolpyruvate carboxylase
VFFPENYYDLTEDEKFEGLSNVKGNIDPNDFENEITKSTIESIQAIKVIQEKNGEFGANRYIISNESALNVLETFAMIRLSDWEKPTVDVVPLFESVEDLLNAHNIMEQLYTNRCMRIIWKIEK